MFWTGAPSLLWDIVCDPDNNDDDDDCGGDWRFGIRYYWFVQDQQPWQFLVGSRGQLWQMLQRIFMNQSIILKRPVFFFEREVPTLSDFRCSEMPSKLKLKWGQRRFALAIAPFDLVHSCFLLTKVKMRQLIMLQTVTSEFIQGQIFSCL